jgi:RNA recognition motif-containing protein
MGRKLYVGNLGFDVNNKDLEDLFAQAGTCESVAVITDRETGQSRGFGFVEMGSNGEAQKAIQQFDGQEFKGRALKVNEAKERESNRGGGGGGGGGGGRGRY